MSGRPADISTVVNAVGHERMAQQRIGTAGKNIYVSASVFRLRQSHGRTYLHATLKTRITVVDSLKFTDNRLLVRR